MRITSLARSIGSASAATKRDQRRKSTYQFAAFCPPEVGAGEGDVTRREGQQVSLGQTLILYSNPGEPWRTSAALSGFQSR
jgi:hypothetical protein